MKEIRKHSSLILTVMLSNKIFKTAILGCIIIFYNTAVEAQASDKAKDTSVKIDLLRAPSSPASNLLGMSASDIEKPTDVTAFMASLRNASNNFTAIPTNYAIEFAPFQLLNKTRPLDSKSLVENTENFRRSFVVSLGLKNEDKNDSVAGSKPKTQFGVGVKFAIIRQEIDDKSKQAFLNIWNFQRELNAQVSTLYKNYRNTDSISMSIELRKKVLVQMVREGQLQVSEFELRTRELNELLDRRDAIYKDSLETVEVSLIKKKISEEVKKIKVERKGFNMDFAAGTVVNFLDNRFDNSNVFKIGSWLTGGWNNTEKNSSLLFILRYLYNPKTSLADPDLNLENLHTLDFGGRLIFTAMEKKFLFSGEAIYRSILNDANATSSWKLIVNAEYEIGINQKLTFSFGRNFDGTSYKSGNVIAALNLLFGFGTTSINAKPPAN